MRSINVLLVEDHTLVRKGLRSLLEEEPDIHVVGEADDGREAVAKVDELAPDIVLMDIAMPGLNGFEATRQICTRYPETKVLILTMYTNDEYVAEGLSAGAAGYVVKQAAPAELVLAIRAVNRGDAFLSPSISKQIIEEYVEQIRPDAQVDSFSRLTPREREVLQLIAEGKSTREIAEILYIAEKTVRSHRASLMEKLDIHSTAELTQYAIRKGVIHPNI